LTLLSVGEGHQRELSQCLRIALALTALARQDAIRDLLIAGELLAREEDGLIAHGCEGALRWP